MKKASVMLLLICFFFASFSQESRDKQAQVDAMKKLEFLTGTWTGKGWVLLGPEQRSEFTQQENVMLKTSGTTLLIEGKGKDINTNELSHEALAVVYYNSQKNEYVFTSHVMQGYHGTYKGFAKQDTFVWEIENPYAGLMKYTITLNEEGQWYEVGERKTKSGDMVQFFEMTLNKDN